MLSFVIVGIQKVKVQNHSSNLGRVTESLLAFFDCHDSAPGFYQCIHPPQKQNDVPELHLNQARQSDLFRP